MMNKKEHTSNVQELEKEINQLKDKNLHIELIQQENQMLDKNFAMVKRENE